MSIPAAPPTYTPTRLRSAWPGRLLIAAVGLLLVLWALPFALAHSPMVGWLEEQLTARLGWSVRIGGMSLGWFSAVTAYDIEIDDGAGRPVLRGEHHQRAHAAGPLAESR